MDMKVQGSRSGKAIISEESLCTTSNAPGVSDEHVLVEDPSPQTESQ